MHRLEIISENPLVIAIWLVLASIQCFSRFSERSELWLQASRTITIWGGISAPLFSFSGCRFFCYFSPLFTISKSSKVCSTRENAKLCTHKEPKYSTTMFVHFHTIFIKVISHVVLCSDQCCQESLEIALRENQSNDMIASLFSVISWAFYLAVARSFGIPKKRRQRRGENRGNSVPPPPGNSTYKFSEKSKTNLKALVTFSTDCRSKICKHSKI